MKRSIFGLAGLAVVLGFSRVEAEIMVVTVGPAGNSADSTGLGSVSYEYHIGKYEVTNAQYVGFLNAVAATDRYGL